MSGIEYMPWMEEFLKVNHNVQLQFVSMIEVAMLGLLYIWKIMK